MLVVISSIISLCSTILIDMLLENLPAFFYAAYATKWLIRGLIFCGFLMSSLILGFKRKNEYCTTVEMIRIWVGYFLIGGLLLPLFTLLPTKIFVEIFALFNVKIHPFFFILLFTVIFIVLIFVFYTRNKKMNAKNNAKKYAN